MVGIAEGRAQKEPVELRFGQAVRAGLLDGVLRREDEERLADGSRDAVDRDVPSSMTSRSAACVFGLARLISSASTMFANTGPSWKENSPVFWSYTVMPVMSPGGGRG
jgi:hypothetical protein